MTAANVQLCSSDLPVVQGSGDAPRKHRPAGTPRYVWFWKWVDQSGGPDACWPWTRARDTAGYGRCGFQKAHRMAYRWAKGTIPASLDICHTCDNPPCCNPAHLWAGTARENIRDAAAKGRLSKRCLDWPQVREIRAAWARGVGQAALSRRHGVSQAHISFIVNNRRWIEPAEGSAR